MELLEFANQILFVGDLAGKLKPPQSPFTDVAPGPAERVSQPVRPADLQFCGQRNSPPMPPPAVLGDPRRLRAAHHIMANHELQAVEVMAFVLRAFPDAPTAFRLGLAEIMVDEQRHTRMHINRVEELGGRFGELPVNGYFWGKAMEFQNLLDYLAGLPLVFEQRNLDHTCEFEGYFLAVGQTRSAAIMRAIHRDEIRHVAFGIEWLRKLKPAGQSDWETFVEHLKWPLQPSKARGDQFQTDARRAAGLSDDFIENIATAKVITLDKSRPGNDRAP